MTPLEFRRDLWQQRTRVCGLSYGIVCMILCLAFLVQYRHVMDGRMDGRTDGWTDGWTEKHDDDSIYHASIASCGKNRSAVMTSINNDNMVVICNFWRHYSQCWYMYWYINIMNCILLCKMYKNIYSYICGLSATIAHQLGSRKVEAVAFVLHNSQSAIHISGKDEVVLCCVFVTKRLTWFCRASNALENWFH